MQVPSRINPVEIDEKYEACITREDKVVKIDAADIYYRDLNAILRAVIQNSGVAKIEIYNFFFNV